MPVDFNDVKFVAKLYWPTYAAKLTDAAAGIIARKFQRCERDVLNREAGTWLEFNTESTKPDWSQIAARCSAYTKTAMNDFDRLMNRLRNSEVRGKTPWVGFSDDKLWAEYVKQEIRLWTHDSQGNMRDIPDDDPRRKMIARRAELMRMQWRTYLQDIGVVPPEFLLERGQVQMIDQNPF